MNAYAGLPFGIAPELEIGGHQDSARGHGVSPLAFSVAPCAHCSSGTRRTHTASQARISASCSISPRRHQRAAHAHPPRNLEHHGGPDQVTGQSPPSPLTQNKFTLSILSGSTETLLENTGTAQATVGHIVPAGADRAGAIRNRLQAESQATGCQQRVAVLPHLRRWKGMNSTFAR